MIELERTFLAKSLPPGLDKCQSKEVIDVYIPKTAEHPTLRFRKEGDRFNIIKKEPVDGDASHQEEQTIRITESEFRELMKLNGKMVRKIRYYYDCDGRTAEIDVFQDGLRGLVLVDFEFSTKEEKDSFRMLDFCLAEVTHEKFLAGGMLCGKKYPDIEKSLRRFNYSRIL
jgi:CYTH domain-containing protein